MLTDPLLFDRKDFDRNMGQATSICFVNPHENIAADLAKRMKGVSLRSAIRHPGEPINSFFS